MTLADGPTIGLLQGLATTRAIRRYTSEDIPLDDLNTILWHATRAPSGSNRQMFRFLVLHHGPRAQQVKHLLGNAFRRGWAAKREADGYARGTGENNESAKSRHARAMQQYVDNFESIPVVVLACLIRHRAPDPYEGASVYPACQNLLLAARALGYGGVLTMWHREVEAELRRELDIPDDVAVSACITIGRPEGHHGPVRRRPMTEFVFDDQWNSIAPWAEDPPGTMFTAPRR